MVATRRIPLLLLLLTTLTTAIELTVSGDPLLGEAIPLTWSDGEHLLAWISEPRPPTQDSFTFYRSFSPIIVTNGVWNVDGAAGILVEFEITDSTCGSTLEFIQTDAGALAMSRHSGAERVLVPAAVVDD